MTAANDNFDFPALAAEIRRDFPLVADKVFFVDIFKKEHIDGHRGADARRDRLLKHSPQFSRQLESRMALYHAEKNSAVLPAPEGCAFVLLYTGPDAISMTGLQSGLCQNLTFIVDHEIGHLVTAYGMPRHASRTLHECSADAYAALRQLQRFENGMQGVEKLRLRRAQRLVSLEGMRHASHFTSFTLEKLIELTPHLPLGQLSAQQTAELAARIAIAHTPNDQIVKNIVEAFAPFHTALAAQPDDDTPYRILAQTVTETKEWEVFKWGAPVLRGYMDGTLEDMRNGEKLVRVNKAPLEGPGWNRVRSALAAREFAFNRDEILFGLDLPAVKAAPAAKPRRISRAP